MSSQIVVFFATSASSKDAARGKCGIRTVKNQRVAELHRIMLVQSSPSSGNIAARRTPLSSWHPPRWAKGSCAWYKTVRCHRWKQSARNCNNEQYIQMKKILFDCIVSHYQPPLILSPPIDRRPKKLENMTHVLADRILRDFRILWVQQEENVASKKWKIIPPPNTQGGCAMHFVVKYVSVPWMLIL